MTEVARFMLDKGLDPNIQNKQGLSSLHLCTMAQNKYMFTLLLNLTNNPVDINIRTHDGHTALWYALHLTDTYEESSFAAQLIKKGAIPNPNEGVLHIACAQGMAKLVSAMLAKGADPNLQMGSIRNVDIGETNVDEKFVSKQSPLHLAVSNNHEGVIRNLKSSSENKNFIPDFNIQDSDGNTPISLALKKGFQHLVGILIEGGADINICDKNELTLLHQAILKADTETALFLLEKGIDINVVTTQNETPLELSIKSHLPTVVDALCRKGVDTSAPTSTNCCPIWMALESGQEDIAAILVRNGADIDYWSEGPGGCLQTLLHRAIDENNENIANFLIHSGCSLNCSRRPGVTGRSCEEAHDKASPLHLCCQWGLTSVVQTLIEHDAAINIKFDNKGYNFLHTAIQKGDVESVLFLLSIHVDINSRVQDVTQTPPLHLAAQLGTEMIIRSLLLAGARADDHDAYRQTALHVAAAAGHEAAVSALLQNGSNFNATDSNGDNALHIAAREGHLSVARVLLTESSLDAETVNIKGQNPLHVLSRYSRENSAAMGELFLECMPNYPLNQPDLHGNTADTVDAYCAANAQTEMFQY
uniref:Uncharacterized protein n=1 Tax=Timema bartmani TaxID=61472 RepID=A0A7R9EYQ6_9NEOP|nr:unnamed protein product [Timema bartmani]